MQKTDWEKFNQGEGSYVSQIVLSALIKIVGDYFPNSFDSNRDIRKKVQGCLDYLACVTGKTTTHLNKAEPVQNSTELTGASSRAVLVTPEMPPMQPIRIINGAGGSGICSFSPDTQHVGTFYTLNTSAPDLSADSIIDQLFVGLDGQ